MMTHFLCLSIVLALTGFISACGDSNSNAPQPVSSEAAKRAASEGEHAEKDEKDHKDGEAPGAPDEHGDEGGVSLTEEQARKEGIKTEIVEFRSVASAIQLTASIVANQDRLAHIAPRVSGKLVRVHASLGDRVKTGQVLAHVDSIEIGSANSEYLQAKSVADLAQANRARAEKLNAEQIIPQKDYLVARSEAERADASLRAARDRLRTLGVGLPVPGGPAASVYPLTAPFSGIVIAKDAVLGELVQPDKPVFSIANLSTVWIEANLFEKDLSRVRPGAKASVVVGAYPDQRFAGMLTYISDTVDAESRTVKARIEVPNPEARLKPGMFATAYLGTVATQEAIAVPSEAIVLLDGKASVFVEENGRYIPRAVTVGASSGAQVPVLEGLSPGESVVVEGVYPVKARLLKSQIGEGHNH